MPHGPSAFLAVLSAAILGPPDDPAVRRVRPDPSTGTPAAVVVPAETALLFTSQALAPSEPTANPSPDQLASEVLDRLDFALRAVGSGLDRAVRLHVVLDDPGLLPALRSTLAGRFPDGNGPGLTVVVGALPRPWLRIAADAVATTDRDAVGRIPRAPVSISVLPAGPRVFVSGQAEPADDLATATRETLLGLAETLDHLGIGADQVVQLKAFYAPGDSAEVVEREVIAFFEASLPPPLVLVEWESDLPIEIELVAAAPGPGGDGPIDYLETPKLAASPVFSRVARVNRGDLVFTSGLLGPADSDGVGQVGAIFDELAEILGEAGGDLDHLAKATYYVSDDDASRALNDLRPRYYDPERPPAASKAQVPGVGPPDRSLTLDMIAVVPARSSQDP
ncbi:Rid family hydrolase [Tautonia plasticadhaerens]|uniref:Endoribonuclease L-PSP n=1 Tax=Tautonia plasticadhaerens TaxID=2527974 RepID=A0A518GVV2_9BACT|nr:Rid family hydrolase [Tautonia plasticadhaerens]QDV32723.1 Endoribonuclease L-PSP [Tautonia plasticadhaerens]